MATGLRHGFNVNSSSPPYDFPGSLPLLKHSHRKPVEQYELSDFDWESVRDRLEKSSSSYGETCLSYTDGGYLIRFSISGIPGSVLITLIKKP
jgi:hypothetical protein